MNNVDLSLRAKLEGWLASLNSMGVNGDGSNLSQAIEIFLQGYSQFENTGETQKDSYVLMRQLFCATNGFFNDMCSDAISLVSRPYHIEDPIGIFSEKPESFYTNVVSSIRQDGYYLFDEKLPEHIIDELKNVAESGTSPVEVSPGNIENIQYDRNNPVGNRYVLNTSEITSSETLQNLISDTSLLKIAQSYLNSKSIIDSVQMWWLTGYSKSQEALDKAALMYHFDMDRLKFLKFFFYLTDVDTNTAPHCYVKGSCAKKPNSCLRDGRFSDEEMESAFSRENIKEICGKKGTIIAVDTRGFHKGKAVEKGERLILQLEYTNSLFGAPIENMSIKTKKSYNLMHSMKKYPETYKLLS